MLLCGATRKDINPPEFPIHLAGYGPDNVSHGVHDDINVTVLYLKNGDEQLAVLTYDMITLDTEFIEQVQSACSEASGIAPRKVLLTVSHTHSVPTIRRRRGDDPGAQAAQAEAAFRRKAIDQSAAAVREAVGGAEPVTVQYNTTRIRENLNRRIFFPNGQYYYQPKQKNLQAVGDGIVDDELLVIFFRCTGRNAYKAVLVNYTAHPLTVGDTSNLVSADYPGALKREIERNLGGTALFINGACGDNHPLGAEAGFGRCERMGQALAEAALYHRWDAVDLGAPEITSDYREIILPVLSKEEFEKLPQNFSTRHRTVSEQKLAEGGLRTYISLWSLGPILFVGVPGELTVELGLRLKWESPFPKTFVMEIATDSVGYIAHRNAYAWGGYEVLTSAVGPGAGGKIVTEVCAAAEKLRAGLEQKGVDLKLPGHALGAVPRNEPGTAQAAE